MPSQHARRRLLAILGAILGGLSAGCLADPPTNADSTESAENTTDPDHGTADPETVATSELSDGTAKQRAYEAEGNYIADRMINASCLGKWGTSATTVSKDLTIHNRTDEGVYVDVTHPYWYSTESIEADGGTHARYLVTANSTQRIRGETVDPC